MTKELMNGGRGFEIRLSGTGGQGLGLSAKNAGCSLEQ